jgi:hypothetical protein
MITKTRGRIMKRLILLSLILCASLTFATETYKYPAEGQAIMSIDFPQAWLVEKDEEMLHATSPDELVYLNLWALQEVTQVDDAIDIIDEVLAVYLQELELNDAETGSVNDLEMVFIDGSGEDMEGNPVTTSVVLFSPDNETVMLTFFVATPTGAQNNKNDIKEIITSIKKL